MDELLKRLLIEIVLNADDAMSDMRTIRSDVEQVKDAFKSLQAQTGESFGVMQSSIKQITIQPIKDKIKDLINDIKLLRNELSRPLALGETEEGRKLDVTQAIVGKQQEIIALQGRLGEVTRATTVAFSELRAEASQIKTPILSAKDAATQFRINVASAKEEMLGMVNSGFTLRESLAGMTQAGQYSGRELSEAFRQVKAQIQQVPPQVEQTNTALTKMGRILERIFAAGIIGMVLGGLRKFVGELKEISSEGVQFVRSMVEMDVAIRALARTGVETTFGEWAEYLKELQDTFKVFTSQDLSDGLSALSRVQRQSGLASDAIKDLGKNVAALALYQGKDFAVVMNAVQDSIEKGWTRGLTEYIGAISSTTLQLEAEKRGLIEAGEEIDKYTKALLVAQLVQEEANKVMGDVTSIQKQAAIQVVGLENSISDARKEIGERMIPLTLVWKAVTWGIYDILSKVSGHIVGVFIPGLSVLAAVLLTVQDVLQGNISSLKDYYQTLIENFKAVNNYLVAAMDYEGIGEQVEHLTDGYPEVESETESFADTIISLFNKIKENFIDMNQDIAKENRDFARDMAEDTLKFMFELQQLYQKLQFDIAKVNRDFNDKVAEANDDYRDKEIKAEEDYQEKLRKLREQFLFDLEDALRERDARQIIRLIRQYNLKKDQLSRERQLEKEDNQRNFEDQLEEIKRQRDARIRELKIEYEFRRNQMAQEFAFEQQQRIREHNARIEEIKIRAKERNEELLRELTYSRKITEEWAKVISNVFSSYFGEDGVVEGTMAYLVGVIKLATEATVASINQIKAAIAGIQSMPKGITKSPTVGAFEGYEYAEGGLHIATRPTLALFGEDGPEAAKFVPLNRTGRDVNKVFSDTPLSSSGGTSNPSEVLIRLADGLEASIIDRAVGVAANVVINVERTLR